MSLLKETSATVLAADTLVLASPLTANGGAPTATTISQELTTTTVITLPSDMTNLMRINVVFTNTLPTTQPVTISVSNASSAVPGLELVLFIRLAGSINDATAITLSPDFFWTACGTYQSTVELRQLSSLVMRFLFNGTVFVNTYDLG
jgi:hypothetical protein